MKEVAGYSDGIVRPHAVRQKCGPHIRYDMEAHHLAGLGQCSSGSRVLGREQRRGVISLIKVTLHVFIITLQGLDIL